MKYKIILSLVLLLIVKSDVSGTSRVFLKQISASMDIGETIKTDSIRKEFNKKKKHVEALIRDKNPETIVTYYKFYLQDNDVVRADILMNELLKIDDSIETKYKVSLISYFYKSDSKTPFLFLFDNGRLNEYRSYFIKHGISKLKTNTDIRTHYYNLVAIDSAYYRIAPDSSMKIKIAQHYNSLAWYSMLTQNFNNVRYFIDQSLKFDSLAKYPTSNLALLMLLENHFEQAKALYLKYKDQPFDKTYSTYKEVFLEDFNELEKEGITSRDIKRIKELLIPSKVQINSKN